MSADTKAPSPPSFDTAQASTPSRAPSSNFECLDGLRFIAAFMVVCAHTLGFGHEGLDTTTQMIHSLGHYGVAVFFCLSGFLLFRPFAAAILDDRPMPALRPYLRNRLLRILPLFWVALFVYVFIFPTSATALPKTTVQWIGMVLVGQVYFNDGINWAIFAAWTLGVELAFYVALPFVSMGLRWVARRAGRELEHRVVGLFGGLAVVAALGLVYKIVIHETVGSGVAANGFPPAWLDWFAAGMGLAVAYLARQRGIALPGWLDNLGRYPALSWLGSFGFFWISVQSRFYFLVGPTLLHSLVRHYAVLIAGWLLLVPAVLGTENRSPIRRMLSSKPMAALGLVSYGIYLWHPGFVKMFWDIAFDKERRSPLPGLGRPISQWSVLGWVSIATLIVATLSYWGVERMFMLLRARPTPLRRDAVDNVVAASPSTHAGEEVVVGAAPTFLKGEV